MAKQRSNNPLMLARHLTQKSVALILAGGRGSHLKELTKTRTKPAVHFGGKFRLVDFTLSNCINSGIRRIGIITQYHSHTLTQHVRRTWSFINTSMNGFVDLLPAQQRCTSEDWYKGTANAVFQNVDIIRAYNAEFVVILAGDHIYKMDYSRMLIDHVESGAECTVACIPVPRREASKFGVMKVDHDNNILKFLDKPKNPPAMPAREDMSLASMGVYVFNANYLYQLLEEDGNLADSLHDFSNDIIPKITTQGKARAHSFTLSCIPDNDNGEPYWCDVRTLDNYWRANLDLASANPRLNIYDKRWPIRTYTESLPPAKLVQDCSGNSGIALNSLISDGCELSGSTVVHSVLSPRVRVSSFCTIDSSVLLPDVKIGRSCRLRRCIIDRACVLPEAMVIGENEEEDSRRFYRSKDGIVLVTREMLARCKEV